MAVVLQATTATSGDAAWVAAAAAGGGVTGVKQRVQLADIQVADVQTAALFTDTIPAGSLILGAMFYVTAAPTGPGLGSCTINSPLSSVAPLNVINGLSLEELFGISTGFPILLNGNQEFGVDNTPFNLTDIEITPIWSVLADINLDTLTAFDVTFYWFYSVPTGITIP